ncbi:MAG: AMP-binding protein [Pseudomonadota bacterium]
MLDILKEMTLGYLIDKVAAIYPDKEALVFNNRRDTYKDLKEKVDRVAGGLLQLGVKKGDKVSVLMSNRPEWIYTKFAIAKIGAILVPINTRYKTHELKYILGHSDSTTLVMMDHFLNYDFIQMIRDICPEVDTSDKGKVHSPDLPHLRNIIVLSDRDYHGMVPFSDVMKMGEDPSIHARLKSVQSSVRSEDIVNIQYTSGTTGFPKGTMLTHHMVPHMFLQGERAGCTPADRMIIFLPLFHIFGNCSALLVAVTHGACVVLQESFNAGESLKLMAEESCTYINCVPTNIIMMMNDPAFPEYRDKLSLKKGLIGGAPIPVQLIIDMVEKMGISAIGAVYGQTECCGITSYSVKGDSYEVVASTVGKPATNYDVKIVDISTGETLPPGKEGELLIRGSSVMRGYYKMPEETAKTLDKEGWCRSGDLFVMDEEGNLKITGRVKDIYISGGENVAPAEVENFLFTHPKIKQVQIVGVPDERWGEVGSAFIELKEGEIATEEEILGFCKGKIATFKIPKYVRFVKEFPLTASGKIQKFILKDSFLKEMSPESN